MPQRSRHFSGHSPISRRRLLELGSLGTIGIVSGAILLPGCSTDSPDADTPTTAQLVPLFNPNRVIAAGIPQRLPFGLVDNGTRLSGDGAPVTARVLRDGRVIDAMDIPGRVVAHDHAPGTQEHQHSGILRYYALRTVLPEAGIYDVELEIDGTVASAPVQAFDPGEIRVLLSGSPFPRLDTPTLDDARGVDPICTLPDGPCPFHEHSAAQLLDEGLPMALLVATPAYCATAYCGPVLETLIESRVAAGGIAMVHVEPYANPRAVNGDLTSPDLRLAPTLEPLGLDYEPVLFLVDSAGTLVDRIDNVFDLSELAPALAALS